MKTFYTERDIEDMHAIGVTEIEIDDDVVLTDLAREQAITYGIRMKRVKDRKAEPPKNPRLVVVSSSVQPTTDATTCSCSTVKPDSSSPPAVKEVANKAELISRIKFAVVARLGSTDHNDLLDQIIPQILTRLGK